MSDNEKFEKIHKILEFIAVGDVLDSRKVAPAAQWKSWEFKHIEFNESVIYGLFQILEKDGIVSCLDSSTYHVNQDKVKSAFYLKTYLSKRVISIPQNYRAMTIDEMTDKLLPKITNIPNHFWALYQNVFGKTDDDNNEIQFLYNYMRDDKRLIEPGTKEEEYIVLTPFGYKVLTEYNGWANFLKAKSDEKLQLNLTVDKSVTQKVEIRDSTIHGSIAQSSDSSDNKKKTIATKVPMSMVMKVLIGIGIGVAVGLILYYGFGIGK